MANVGQTWTEDRIELLTKLWREGLSASQIAAELGGDVVATRCSAKLIGSNLFATRSKEPARDPRASRTASWRLYRFRPLPHQV